MADDGSSGKLTTHVLDLATGLPAAGLSITLYRLDGDSRSRISATITNSDGRTNAPMLAGDDFATGIYELEFAAGDYLKSSGADIADIPFLDVVPIRFGISDAGRHYHVPLLLSPYGYSTYRGS